MPDRDATPAGIADLHVHTRYSDGADGPREVLEWAERIGLDVIAITDHDTIDGAIVAVEMAQRSAAAPHVIIGEEVSSRDGHILALFISRLVPPDLTAAETVAAIHEQGGLAVAAHPYWRRDRRGNNGRVYGAGDLIRSIGFDAVEVLNGGFTPSMIGANRAASAVARSLSSTEVGGSDAHVKHAIGWAHTRFAGTTAAELRQSLVSGTTQAARSRLGLVGLRRYAFWSIGRLRLQQVAG
ncbi:MAG TPA: PHP domain-containing protein [Chloroflexota bacterium]